MSTAPIVLQAAGEPVGAPRVAQAPLAAPAIPFKRDTTPAASALGGGVVGVLVISVVAIAAVLWIRKRLRLDRRESAAPRLLHILETQRLGPRALLSVVEFDGKRYLISQGEHGVSCLATAAAREPA